MREHFPEMVKYYFSVIYNINYYQESDILDLLAPLLNITKTEFHIFRPEQNPSLSYYSEEMGGQPSLKRIFLFSYSLEIREKLPMLKVACEEIESQHRNKNKDILCRPLNIDPGYLALEHIVLSTHKPFAHRFYLGNGVYAEIEFLFKNKRYESLPWTYPDYADVQKSFMWIQMRQSLLESLRLKNKQIVLNNNENITVNKLEITGHESIS